jgi:CRISPR/Cas system-associated exonuclease Cas4 (RecB family)
MISRDFSSSSTADTLPSSSHSLTVVSAHDIIHQLNPAVIPRISAIADMAWCERAAYNVSFFGVNSDSFSDEAGEIGNAIHRIVIKSTLEIVDLIKNGHRFTKADAVNVFLSNASQEIELNWKQYALAGIEQPLPLIMQDLDIRADRLSSEILASAAANDATTDDNNNYKKIILRPEFTIRNKDIPLEGRLDLLKIKFADHDDEDVACSSSFSLLEEPRKKYVTTDDLLRLKIQDIEIVQIKTGRAKDRSPRIYMQADAEALLLMQTLKLTKPPKYIWQFADKDVQHRKFNFAKVYEAIDKYIKLWKSEQSPEITGYCPKCPLRNACRDWHFARAGKLSEQEQIRRRFVSKLSKRIRQEIADTDRWKVYISFRTPEEREADGWTINGLKVDMDNIDLVNQEVTLVSEKGQGSFGNFIDFSVGDFVTISDGNPNLGSNPTAIISDIDLEGSRIKIQSIRNDLYILTYDNRHNSSLTIDRFDFDKGLTTIKYLDGFYRQSPYADIVLGRVNSAQTDNNDDNNCITSKVHSAEEEQTTKLEDQQNDVVR